MFGIVNLSKDFNWHQSTFNWFSFYSDTLKLRMRFWKRRAAKKNAGKCQKVGSCIFFAPFFQSRHLSNGDLRMRAHRIVYHIIVLLSWFWVGILRSPRSSILWFSPTTDFIFQVLPAFWTHFAFFLGCSRKNAPKVVVHNRVPSKQLYTLLRIWVTHGVPPWKIVWCCFIIRV